MSIEEIFYATGKRKSAIARTWIKPGKGEIIINGLLLESYFKNKSVITILKQPLILTDTDKHFDIKIKVKGGGFSGQASAMRHGITKALVKFDSNFRLILKKSGFITRDSRIKERKKYGQRGARARFQFSKR